MQLCMHDSKLAMPCTESNKTRFTEKYDMTLSDMAKSELRGHFKEAVLAWVDAAADPTKGVELVFSTWW